MCFNEHVRLIFTKKNCADVVLAKFAKFNVIIIYI